MGAKQNLRQYLNAMNISPAQFYRDTGLSNGFLNQGDNISSNNIEIIISIYKNLNLSWLITGLGEMLNNKESYRKSTYLNTYPNTHQFAETDNKAPTEIEKKGNSTINIETKKPSILDNESPVSVPFYDLPVSAGSLGILDIEVAKATIPNGYVQLDVFRGCEYIFPVVGISMEPYVYSGDWIGVKPIDGVSYSWDFIQTGVIYLIITREDRMIKYIEEAADHDYIVCSSPNYHPFKVYKGDILEMYRVKAVARGV